MDLTGWKQVSECTWEHGPTGATRVPAVIHADRDLMDAMDDKVAEQVCNVAMLPGIVGPSYAMPDAHWGYGFPIGGVAAFDVAEGGVISAGGVGFDISCGARTLRTGVAAAEVERVKRQLVDILYDTVPTGVGAEGKIRLSNAEMDAMLVGGAAWAVGHGWGEARDLDYTEEHGRMRGADAGCVSDKVKKRQRREMGTLGSGNHYL